MMSLKRLMQVLTGPPPAFTFQQRIAARPSLAPAVDLLGGLRTFLAGASPRAWAGQGFTLIWRPNHGQSGPKDFFLQLMFTNETLTFTDITGSGIANRGELQDDILLGGLEYRQTVTDLFDGSGQHLEPGVWISVPATTNPLKPATVARMGTIPHGTTIELQGTVSHAAQPLIPPVSITPFQIGNPGSPVPFPEELLAAVTQSRTPLTQVVGLHQDLFTDPNLLLRHHIASQTIISTTVIAVSQDMPPNIDFLGPNARASHVSATFWIERVAGDAGEFAQLQYSQTVLLDFNGLSWPHVSVATLTAKD